MKNPTFFGKSSLAIFFLLGSFVLTAAQNIDQSARAVKGRILISKDAPELRLKFGKKFKFAGSQRFVLYDRANAEQYFFVEAANNKIKRLYMLQFEGFLPKIDGTYDYNEPQTVEIGGSRYFSNTENIANVEAALSAVPGSDIAKAAKFLQDKGFTLMKSLKYQRFVRVLDEDKRREFIILYIEDADIADLSKQSEDFQRRALANFKVLK